MAEGAAVSVGTSVVGKIGELLVPHVIRHISFLFRYKKHIEKLRDRVPDLESARKRLEIKIKEATDNLDEINTNVELWIKNASELIQEAHQFMVAEAEANKRCCGGLCPNFMLRRKLARKAYKTMQRVIEMSDREPGKSGEKISYPPKRKYTNKNEGYQAFGTRRDTFEKIKAALKPDKKTRMVLVHGMAGAGKTMLANEIAKQVKGDRLFSDVIFVAVSQKPDYKAIQEEIAGKLGLSSLKNMEKLEERADLLRERLARESNVLIILDDIWKELPLSRVGIYFGDDQKGCKILVTSRVTNVLQDDKHTTLKFEIKVLLEDESITLFNDIVGSRAKEGEFQELATKMVGECGQLPLAVAVVASALKNKELDEWKDALVRLKRSIPSGIDGMSDFVFKSIELSYDFLDDVEAQSIFLLCCMQEEDKNVYIHYLLTFSFGLGIYQEVYTLEDARCRIRALISKLKHHSLLLEGYSHDFVKVHDVVRDFGIYTASTCKAMYTVRSNDEFNHRLREKTLQNAIAISLLYDEKGKLPKKLESPLVKLLWMWKGHSKIPDSFFEETKDLRVLDSAGRNLSPLPSSFGCLENLRVLNLGSSNLGDISIIGNFKLLQVLEFSLSDIKYIPKEIGQLTNLRELDMFGCDSLTTIHPDVLSKLKELERLNLSGTPIQWEDGDERMNASLTELEELPNLKALYLKVSTAQIVSTNLLKKMSGFSDYEILIHETQLPTQSKWNTVYDSKKLELNLESSRLIEELGLGMLLSSSEEVILGGIQGVNSLIPQINEQGFLETKHMTLNATQIRYIVCPFSSHPSTAFERLESLRLRNLEKLELICRRQLSSGSFRRLQQLNINNCNKLKSLFSFSVAKLLVQLQKIDVRKCNMIEEIITCDGQSSNDAGTIEFPQLQLVNLESLPKLKTFFNHKSKPSQGTPVPLFSRQVIASELTNLDISNCESSKYLFSSTFASRLPKLYYIYMKECSIMKEIITMDEKVEEIQFPQLRYLYLRSLPKLRNMCGGGISTRFPLTTELKMEDCKFEEGQKIIFASDVA